MTKEQLGELAEALSILTAKSSIVKERDELKAILEDNLLSEAESKERPDEADQASIAVSKRVRSMIKKIDSQLEKYDEKVGSSLNVIQSNAAGQISLADLQKALRVIKHAPQEDVVESLGKKLDVDQDGFVVSHHHLRNLSDIPGTRPCHRSHPRPESRYRARRRRRENITQQKYRHTSRSQVSLPPWMKR